MPTWDFQYDADVLPQNGGLTKSIILGTLPVDEIIGSTHHAVTGNADTSGVQRTAWFKTFGSNPSAFTFLCRVKLRETIEPGAAAFIISPNIGLGVADIAYLWNAFGTRQFVLNGGAVGLDIDWTQYHFYRLTFSLSGTWTVKLFVDESSTPSLIQTGLAIPTLPNQLRWYLNAPSGDGQREYDLDLFYYSVQGAFEPGQLPATAPQDFCEIPRRVNTILSGRAAFAFATEGQGSAPAARATQDVFNLHFHEGLRRPAVVTWIEKAAVRRQGIRTWVHDLKLKTVLFLRDFSVTDYPRLGAAIEDVRAAFEHANNPALNELTDIQWSRDVDAKVIEKRAEYQLDRVDLMISAALERRYSDDTGAYVAGGTNPRTVQKAVLNRIKASADFEPVIQSYNEGPPRDGLPQPNAWPAVYVAPDAHPVTKHRLDEHQSYNYNVVFEDRAFEGAAFRVCRFLNFIRDFEDMLHAESTLNGETGVRNAYLTGYEHRWTWRDEYSYPQMWCKVTVETDKD